jgi:hypothetical protein
VVVACPAPACCPMVDPVLTPTPRESNPNPLLAISALSAPLANIRAGLVLLLPPLLASSSLLPSPPPAAPPAPPSVPRVWTLVLDRLKDCSNGLGSSSNLDLEIESIGGLMGGRERMAGSGMVGLAGG